MDTPDDSRRDAVPAEVGHALRTALTILRGNLQLAIRVAARSPDPGRDRLLRHLGAAMGAADRLTHEVERLDAPGTGPGAGDGGDAP